MYHLPAALAPAVNGVVKYGTQERDSVLRDAEVQEIPLAALESSRGLFACASSLEPPLQQPKTTREEGRVVRCPDSETRAPFVCVSPYTAPYLAYELER